MNTFPPSMLVKSISVAAANATVSPGTLQPFVDEVEAHVRENGKFAKSKLYTSHFRRHLSSGTISAGSAVSGRGQTPAQ